MILKGYELRDAILNGGFYDGKPFQMKFPDGTSALNMETVVRIEDEKEYVVILRKTMLYGGEIPFNVFEVRGF